MNTTQHITRSEGMRSRCTCEHCRESRRIRLNDSAPDMFDALQAVCDAYGEQDSLLMAQVKAALDKAKGGAK